MFYALLIPLLLLFAGVGINLGWYYLNVSRLQNAADAAVVADAQEFVNDNTAFKTFIGYRLVSNRSFEDNRKYTALDTLDEQAIISKADATAESYAVKNLGDKKEVNFGTDENKILKTVLIDSWNISKDDKDKKVDMSVALYDYGTAFYYVVDLKENIKHLFMPGLFPPMNAPVRAVVKLSPNEGLTNDELDDAKNENVVVGNWEVQNIYRKSGNKAEFENRFGYEIYDGKWNMYQDSKNHYYKGDNHRTETINVTPAKTGNSFSTTDANGKKYYDETQVDSLDIDFKPEVTFNTTSKWLKEDWDLELGYDSSVSKVWNNDWDTSGKYKYNDIKMMRIHSTINFDEPYKTRPNATENPDILWVRIESETMLHYPDSPNGEPSKKVEEMRSFNSIHQIIINFNSDNTGKSNGKDIYRPVIIFYDGPETNDSYYDSHRTNEDVLHRESLPVIVNLNADFQGVLYMPNSSVVLNNNGYKFNGFIVAKNYLTLKTEKDFYKDEETGKYYDSEEKIPSILKSPRPKTAMTIPCLSTKKATCNTAMQTLERNTERMIPSAGQTSRRTNITSRQLLPKICF